MHLCLITVIDVFQSAEVFVFSSKPFVTSSKSWLCKTTKLVHTTLLMLYAFWQNLTLTQAFITSASLTILFKTN